MNKKRILFLLTNEEELLEAKKFSKALKNKISDLELVAVYVKDILKYELFLTNMNGFIQNSTAIVVNEYKNLENSIYKRIKEQAIDSFDRVYSVEGETNEVILEELKAYDALVVVKSKELTVAMKNLLQNHYKPLIILGNQEEYHLDKILMLNDGGYKVNKSVFDYFHLFGEQKIDVLRINVEERNRLNERFGDVCNIFDESGDVYDIINQYIPNYDMVIIGELRYTVLFERLTGQIGIKIIENAKNPIFMG